MPPFCLLGLTAVNLLGNSFPPGFQIKTSPGWGLGKGSRGGGNVPQGWCALLSKHFFFFQSSPEAFSSQHPTPPSPWCIDPERRRARRRRGEGSVERPMSGAGEALAPGPQRGAEAGGGRLGAPAQGECRLQVCKLLCHCCILKCVRTFTAWNLCVGNWCKD